jgi:hypothetical protein
MTDEQNKTLIKKLAKIMSDIGPVEKTGWNNFNKYKYTTEADVQAITSKKMAKENLMLIPFEISHETKEVTTRKGNVEQLYTGTWDFSIEDGDSGEKIIVRVSGQGQDSGDKAAFKALTGAHKYALMKLFQISTGDDPERDVEGHQPQPNSNNQNYNQPNHQNQNSYQQQPNQQQEPNINELIVGYVNKLKNKGVDIQSLYADIARAEGVQSIKQADNSRIYGHLKAYYLSLENSQKQQQQNVEQGSMLEGRTTNVIDWGNA